MTVRGRFWLWTGAMLALALLFGLGVARQLKVETDLLALLPADERDAGAAQALRSYSDALGRKALFLVGAAEPAQALEAARDFAAALCAPQVFEAVRLEVDAPAAAGEVYLPYRHGLLSARLRARLEAGDTAALYDAALHAIYSPAGLPRPLPVVDDPLNLLGDFLAQPLSALGAARLQDGVLMVSDARLNYVLVSLETRGSPFSSEAQERLVPVIERALAQARARPGVVVLGSGLILHAAAATRSATREIGSVGSLSLAGVALMVLLTFRSPRPLLLSMLVLGSGALAAVTACHFLFGRLHLITLLFGSGLIGVAVDYSNHFLADQFRAGDWSPPQAVGHVGPGIAMGMSCAILGYLALSLAPLPGLRQMAVFCAVGLAVSCAGVLFWYPVLARRARRRDAPLLMRLAQRFDALLGRLHALAQGRALRAGLLALAALGALGLWRLQFADDVRLLQSSSPELLRSEQAVRETLRSTPDSRLFLVRGGSPAAVLEAEERLGDALDTVVAQGQLLSYLALSRSLPSPARQARNRALLERTVHAPGGLAPRLLAQLGFDAAAIERSRMGFTAASAQPLELEPWLQSTAGQPYRHLWLGSIDGGYASIVGLIGIRDIAALQRIEVPGVQFIDRVAEISAVLGRYREIAGGLIAGAYLLIGLLLARRYGAAAALRLLAVPVGAALLTLALFGLLGLRGSLFNVLALFLVLGLGVDYAVFLREGRAARGATLLALSLSTLGTVLSYGLLAFSTTPFIRSLGLTLLVGVSLTWLFALLSQRPQPE